MKCQNKGRTKKVKNDKERETDRPTDRERETGKGEIGLSSQIMV